MSHDSSLPADKPSQENPAWYRQFWPWFLIVLPACTVIAGITTVTIAFKHADDVVVDDWYKEGRGINRSMAEEQLAERLGLSVRIHAGDDGELVAELMAATPIPWPESLQVSLRHPTLSERDQLVELAHESDGRYFGSGTLGTGQWDMTLTPDAGQWRLYQRVSVNNDAIEAGAAF